MTSPFSPSPVFAEAISVVVSDAGAVVLARLEAWRLGPQDKWRQVALNIEMETALSPADFVALLTDFATALQGSKEPPETCWVEVCRRSHQLKGTRLPAPVPAIIGRAAPITHQAKVISDSPGVGLSPDQCDALLRRVAMAGATVGTRDGRFLGRALVGRHLVWATFCAAHPADGPFEHLPRNTEAIRTVLGLGECSETETLVLLSYRTQGSHGVIELFRPTVGDADGYHWYRPHSEAGAPHGMTCPLAPNAAGLAPQPEVVHRPVTGETLVFPIYLAV